MGPEQRTRDIGGTGTTTDFTPRSATCCARERARATDGMSPLPVTARGLTEARLRDTPDHRLRRRRRPLQRPSSSGTRTRRGRRSGSQPSGEEKQLPAGTDPARRRVSPCAARNVSRRRAAVRRGLAEASNAFPTTAIADGIDRARSGARRRSQHRGKIARRRTISTPESIPKLRYN